MRHDWPAVVGRPILFLGLAMLLTVYERLPHSTGKARRVSMAYTSYFQVP